MAQRKTYMCAKCGYDCHTVQPLTTPARNAEAQMKFTGETTFWT